MAHDRPFDAGLQPERTLLAWRRTALALGVGSLAGARISVPVLGAVGVAVGLVGAIAALAAYTAASFRYRRTHRALVGAQALPGGALPLAAMTGGVILISVAALAYVLVLFGGRITQ
jgi:uncharacterized membrane protein YidH (DUF202 family)